MQSKLSEVLERREQQIIEKWLELQSATGKRMSGSGATAGFAKFTGITGKHSPFGERAAEQPVSEAPSGTTHGICQRVLCWARERRIHAKRNSVLRAGFFSSLMFLALRDEFGKDSEGLMDANWEATELLDKLGLFTLESYQKTREDIISRQQQELLELSTPVVRLWDDVLALPLIGTLDSARTQIVMQNLLRPSSLRDPILPSSTLPACLSWILWSRSTCSRR